MDSITPDLDEALRYAGVRADESGDMHRKMAEIAAQCMKTVTPRCTYRVSEIAWENGMPSLFGGQLVLPGRTAAVMLRSCSHAALLVCTLGTTFDALARQVQARDFADALLLDGFGGAYVEAGCNAAEREIAAKLPLISRRAGPPTAFPLGEATLTKNSHVCRNGTATGLYPAGKEQLCPKSFVLKT